MDNHLRFSSFETRFIRRAGYGFNKSLGSGSGPSQRGCSTIGMIAGMRSCTAPASSLAALFRDGFGARIERPHFGARLHPVRDQPPAQLRLGDFAGLRMPPPHRKLVARPGIGLAIKRLYPVSRTKTTRKNS